MHVEEMIGADQDGSTNGTSDSEWVNSGAVVFGILGCLKLNTGVHSSVLRHPLYHESFIETHSLLPLGDNNENRHGTVYVYK